MLDNIAFVFVLIATFRARIAQGIRISGQGVNPNLEAQADEQLPRRVDRGRIKGHDPPTTADLGMAKHVLRPVEAFATLVAQMRLDFTGLEAYHNLGTRLTLELVLHLPQLRIEVFQNVILDVTFEMIPSGEGTGTLDAGKRASHPLAVASSIRGLTKDLKIDDLTPFTQKLYHDLLGGERYALARSITLVESSNRKKALEARKLLTLVEKHMRLERPEQIKGQLRSSTFRIGLSGPPGAGKSTFIENFGASLTSSGHRVAVLAVDPSSGTTGGSLLGDKTRMPNLTRDLNAYIRPSPNRGHLGGVTRTTNEAIILCEAAGYDIILVETVGVGQSEYLVADMVDMFCLLIPPAGGDELQGIKRGIVEQSDLIIVNKCDGDLIPAARRIKGEYTSALKFMRSKNPYWKPKVKLVSSLTREGLPDIWDVMTKYKDIMVENDELERKRANQRKKWMWNYINDRLVEIFVSHPLIKNRTSELEAKVEQFQISPGTAADLLIEKFIQIQE
eukprot:maker-scaffold362_size196086-snap-gene-0.27 protein:Tk09342 transcript:maker-scaffold362_size196086-snap-gene-0.27-mRNA-1 annotation:"hypothetical protein CAPTEDRAFT_114900"